MLPSDVSVLTSWGTENRHKMHIKPVPLKLGLDLGFRSGNELNIPLRDLGGNGNRLTAIFSVTPEKQLDGTVYFSQKWRFQHWMWMLREARH